MAASTISNNTTSNQLTGMSLFSGMGGDTLGMEQAGVKVIAYNEKVPAFQNTHEANFPDSVSLGGDILKIEDSVFAAYKGKINFLFAGFPCQSFSTGGKRLPDDPRNTMFREFVRVAREVEPDVVIGENVKGLLTKKTQQGDLYINVIENEFRNLGYSVESRVLKCHEHGVPQRRERVIILGIKTHLIENGKYKLAFPEPQKGGNLPNLTQIIEKTTEGALLMPPEFNQGSIPDECAHDVDELLPEPLAADNAPHPYLLLKRDTAEKAYSGREYTNLFSFGKRDSPIHCELLDERAPCKTLICTYGHQPRLLVPFKSGGQLFARTLTVDEMKQIQGFPADYQVLGNRKDQVTQIGNAVPPPLIRRIVETVIGQ